ncbi:spore coat protein YsxE [Salirhabdus euzebyi]|uniref:Spore coat protein YsxE n=1 Tax=Salirhabdus euzebyi TaxID=394506 RepID=A0A841PSY4_9BACI|nr:phosphotransferase [Salirhabdus euzebyi]MBB6451929.1 spore coat protein YsxE [Salirhabdus euzebyi]
MSKLQNILKQYGMQSYQGEKLSPNALKVYTGNQYVVIKQSKNSGLEDTFRMVYQTANEKQLATVAPLYISKDNTPIIKGKNHNYYVMPWFKAKMNESMTSSYHLFFKELGYIHQKTIAEKSVDLDNINNWTDAQKSKVKNTFYRFEKWIALFEAKHFMSPTELLLCHLYRDMRELCYNLEYWFGEWRDHISKEEKMRIVLCHGNLAPSHFIHTENGMVFINWENAFYGHPAKDISRFFYHVCRFHDAPINEMMEALDHYHSIYPFYKSDYALFALHLLNTDRLMKKIAQYIKNKNAYAETEWVRQFQQFHFYYKHALYIQQQLRSYLVDDEEMESEY